MSSTFISGSVTVLVLAHSVSGLNFGRSENDIDEGKKKRNKK